jgi:hypothetical protein
MYSISRPNKLIYKFKWFPAGEMFNNLKVFYLTLFKIKKKQQQTTTTKLLK